MSEKKSLSSFLSNSVTFLSILKLISKPFLYQSSAAVINGLGIYLVDYRGCIFTTSM